MIINSLIKIHNRAQLIKAFLNNRYFFWLLHCSVSTRKCRQPFVLRWIWWECFINVSLTEIYCTLLHCEFFFYNPSRFCAFLAKRRSKNNICYWSFFNSSLLKVPYPQLLPTSIYTARRGQRGFILLNILRPNWGSRTLLARWSTNWANCSTVAFFPCPR